MTSTNKHPKEVNDLLHNLQNAINEKDQENLRGITRKIILYMTLGIDVSGLFVEMVKVNSKHLVAQS